MTKQEWLIANYKNSRLPVEELTKQFNAYFNTNIKPDSLKNMASRLGVKKPACYRVFQEQERQWLVEHFNKYDTNQELFNEFKKAFNLTTKDSKGFRDVLQKLGLKRNGAGCGKEKTQFKYGERNNSQKLHKIGEEVNYKGTVWVKVQDIPAHKNDSFALTFRRNWEPKKHYYWEKYNHKKVPTNCCVIQLNGDINDYSKDNLMLITRNENLQLNRMNASNKGEITLTALDIIKAKGAINELLGK